MSVPNPCDREMFTKGKPILAVDTGGCRAEEFEVWVQQVAKHSGQRVNWHYSGGVAQMLYIGDRSKVADAITILPSPGRFMRTFTEEDPGLYSKDVTPTPPNAIAGFYDGGPGSTYIVEEDKK